MMEQDRKECATSLRLISLLKTVGNKSTYGQSAILRLIIPSILTGFTDRLVWHTEENYYRADPTNNWFVRWLEYFGVCLPIRKLEQQGRSPVQHAQRLQR